MIELIAGGARSGKSSYALKTAESLPGNKIFVATAKVNGNDLSMTARVARHRAERGPQWSLIEAPSDLAAVVANAGREDVLLIDCLTLWLSNWLCGTQADSWSQIRDQFLEELCGTEATVLLVTNEVGMGIVPMGQLSRDFVDESGWLHQKIAVLADKVTLVTFGIATQLK